MGLGKGTRLNRACVLPHACAEIKVHRSFDLEEGSAN
jgi:hypothetical protein